ncbi:beta-Ala-His dipeptidase [Paraburkholderia phenoliruptrix]|uniref:beta-Ala-His dipeptidase n=1 Tax=Paraburkholderia phenoliruptrix TaxID=252970 RepID=UPI0028698C41|nr:beta-Ala-His dipeptidase [Paraburkholderia phenoliruptrix]WMY11805.1 beta-Ala-His dipeptidase [Paraburkholderia phenoliruptrix]
MSTIQDLEPRQIISHFSALSAIPRGSQNEKAVSDYVADFARARGLEVRQDAMSNLLVRKPGTKGYENAPTVILHGHLDMVCEKNDGVEHDFINDGIRLVVDGDYIRADGTSLGADNGVGIAFIMALLESTDIAHPPLEAVMTVMEEMGKAGVAAFDMSQLRGSRMIDFNWVTERQILAGCGGDVTCTIDAPAEWTAPAPGSAALKVRAAGLAGGHCEFQIHLERANGILLIARVFNALAEKLDVTLASFDAGAQNNVIPAHGDIVVVLKGADVGQAREIIAALEDTLRKEFAVADPTLHFEVEDVDVPAKVFSPSASKRLTQLISVIPNGIQSMSRKIDGLVESSNNVGTVRMTDSGVTIASTITAGVGSRKHDIFNRIRNLTELAGGGMVFKQFGLDAPEFPPTEGSPVVAAAVEAYAHVHKEKPEVLVSSCSLELGFFCASIPGLDTVSLGVELHSLHSPRERVGHASIAKTWALIQDFMPRLH